MSSDTQNRKKPNKKKRAGQEPSQEPTAEQPSTKPGQNIDTFDPKQRLRAHLNSMKKDRAKGSHACEENANYDY